VMHPVRRILTGFVLLFAVPSVVTGAWAQSQPQPQPLPQVQPGPRPHRLFGSIASVSGGSFALTDRGGHSVTVHTTASTRILSREQATLADIHPGDTVRIVATKASDGTLTARSVQDVTSGPQTGAQDRGGIWQSRSGMMMIGGSVTGLSGSGTLTVTSPNGQKTPVMVPSTARLSRLAPMPVSNLKVGTRVLVRGMSNPDGSVTASAVFVAGTASK
jgi:Domain of unknown function (DUF5666)